MKKLQKWLTKQSTLWIGLVVLVVLAVWLTMTGLNDQPTVTTPTTPTLQPIVFGPKTDDWVYDSTTVAKETAYPGSLNILGGRGAATDTLSSADSATSNLGFAVGGANDISNFRQNVASGYLPSPADISPEGIFYDYFFDTGQTQECDQLFCPSYTAAVSADPFSGQNEHFLSVGLNSNIKESDFDRKSLNLVVVLDISGSMTSSLDNYYYDRFGRPVGPNASPATSVSDEPTEQLSKMMAANQSLVALLDHLRPEDRLGVVLFDDQSYIAKKLNFIGETDLEALKDHILDLAPQGGTNMEAGYSSGTELLAEYYQADPDNYENRIIFLTDAMPNTGDTSRSGLTQLASDNADKNIYTSFIGIGVDFNADLVSSITQTKGANYHSVHSTEDFKRRLDEGFDYMVTPLVFDLALKLEADGYDIKAVYGSPEADLATGEIMKVNTLFPSLTVDGETRGGLILLHLEKTSDRAELKLTVDYRDRGGQEHQNSQTIDFADESGFANTGIHKGVVLSRMVNTIKGWLDYESQQPASRPDDVVGFYRQEGISVIEPIELGYWERGSRPLRLSEAYQPIMASLRDYLSQEVGTIGDDSLDQEIELIDLILDATN